MTKRKHMPLLAPDREVRPIPGFEGRYSVSRDGRIWSHAKKNGVSSHGGRWLKPGLNRTGYWIVALFDGSGLPPKGRTFLVHRAVALAWVSNLDPSKQCINHLNGQKLDNRDVNLEWCTYGENNAHALRAGLRSPRARRLTREQAIAARDLVAAGRMGKDVAAQFNVSPSIISEIVTNGRYIDH